jgi:glycosyltransferase involved in cell wall biosynthesis
MRIVIDMQGAQSESRFRGIGRYSLEFAKSVARNRNSHDVILALNGALPDSIAGIRKEFSDLLPRDCIRVWSPPSGLAHGDPSRSTDRHIAQVLREQFLLSLNPDIVHVTSLFEGYLDDAVTGIGWDNAAVPVSSHCYDLIPMLNPEIFLDPSPGFKDFYESKLATLQKASLILTISDSAKREIEALMNLQE